MISFESVHILVTFFGYHMYQLKETRNCAGQKICVAVLLK